MRGFGRLAGRALQAQTSKAAANEHGVVFISRRLTRFASSTTSFRGSRYALSAYGFSSLQSSSVDSLYWKKWTPFGGQKRTMFIQTQSTPNPSSLMFYPASKAKSIA
ncbi:hypothetical protein K1719_034604 [Acacia pycnantha]|nr:hypothetical protein K1719_034604 [Acacia pycnantha]